MANPRDWTVAQVVYQINAQERILESTAPPVLSDLDRALTLDLVSGLWGYKFEKTRVPGDIEKAIGIGRQALRTVPAGNEADAAVLASHLHAWLVAKFDAIAVVQDLNDAVEVGNTALGSLRLHSSNWWSTRYNQDSLLWSRYKALGEPADLDTAIHFERMAIQIGEHPRRASMFSLLGALLAARFLLTAAVSDIEEAIQVGYRALEDCPPAGTAALHCNLASSLHAHYVHTRISRSLDAALEVSMEAFDMPETTFGLHSLLISRGTALVSKYEIARMRNPGTGKDLLEQAIQAAKMALKLVPEGHTSRPSTLNRIGIWMGAQFRDTEAGAEEGDLEQAIRHSMDAVSEAPPQHPNRPQFLSDLAANLEAKFRFLRQKGLEEEALASLDEAIRFASEAVDTTIASNPDQAERLSNLGAMWHAKYTATTDNDFFTTAKQRFTEAAGITSAPPRIRLVAAHKAGRFYLQDGQWQEADLLLKEATDILPRVSTLSPTIADQRDVLREISGLATASAAAALHAGRSPAEALQRLEAARCVIAEISMRAKGDIPLLRETDPSLATKYETLRNQVSRRVRELDLPMSYLDEQRLQSSRVRELGAIENQIRRLPGLERFQLPLAEEDFISLAHDGPIITFNVERTRSEAIVVDRNGIRIIPLPDLTYVKAKEKVRLFAAAGTSSRRDVVLRARRTSSGAIRESLQWLWDVVVQVVLNDIELTDSKRVWWVTSGLLGCAPLHVAGNYGSDISTENTIGRVISSYISSFKALRFARQQGARGFQTERSLLLVTMPTSPFPYRNLDTALEESAAQEIFGSSVEHLKHSAPEAVLQRLSSFGSVHFACHGWSASQDPSTSGMLLVKDGIAAMLTVSDLEKIDLKRAEIAYLSACSTAEIGDGALQDEAIHLANSFQALGFPHVIGSIWGADDEAAGKVAYGFYRRLFSERYVGERGTKSLGVARALHDSILEYMSDCHGVSDVLKWGPFIHIGS
ncbi:hypothetical protein BDZ45DRAFT_679218 [Acephala macrosclerotiorum]|nr:hypothetical protein BDZ45DRAFT_679218 [Acephala macrosclerotiorum]